MNTEARQVVLLRAEERCEYCKWARADAGAFGFHIEHIYAKKHGGTDDLQNLCLSCRECNLAKASNLSGLLDDKIVPLFHPRRQVWSRHFLWDGPILVGRTLCGKATIKVLNINDADRVEFRQILIDEGRFPPGE